MAFRKGFFTSDSWTLNEDGFAIGNKAEGSDFLAKIIATIAGDGVPYLPTSNLQCVADAAMNVKLVSGFGFKGGYMAWEDADRTIAFTSSASEQTFYISARLDVANNEFTGDQFNKYTTFVADTDLCVAKVVIPANAVTITNDMITDLRDKPEYCGFITDQREYLEQLILWFQNQIANVIGGALPDHASTHAAAGDDPIDLDACNGVMYTSQTLTAGEQTQARTNISAAKASGGVIDAEESAIPTVEKTTDYTVTASENGYDIQVNSADPVTITIDTQANKNYPAKFYCYVTRLGEGTVTIAGAGGVTLQSAGSRLKVAEQYGTILIRKRSDNIHLLTGNFTA